MAGQFPDLDVHFEMGEVGTPDYEVTVGGVGSNHMTIRTLEEEILGQLANSNAPISKRYLAECLGVEPNIIRKAINNLIKLKKIVPQDKGYIIPKR